jgi:succinate dehydrogenase hydrophobic membrane anchor protein
MRQTGSYAWLFQMVSGVLLVICLFVHFFMLHYMGFEQRLHDEVVTRLESPVWKSFYLLFLSLGLFHGFNGAWAVVVDYVKRDVWRIGAFVIIVTLAVSLFLLGAVTILSFP